MNNDERSMTLHYAADTAECSGRVAMDRCSDAMNCELEELDLQDHGRLLEVSVRLKNVCPGKRTALGISLHEIDERGGEAARGMRTLTVPAHGEACSRDIVVTGVRFVLPGDLCTSGNGERRLIARATAHYVDMDSCSACATRRN